MTGFLRMGNKPWSAPVWRSQSRKRKRSSSDVSNKAGGLHKRTAGFVFWGPLSSAPFPAGLGQRLDIEEILWTAAGSLDGDQVVFADDGNEDIVPTRAHAPREAGGKVSTRNPFDDVNPHRRHAHPKDILVECRLKLFEHGSRRAKFFERSTGTFQVLGRVPDPQVDVLRKPWPRVESHGVATDDEIINVVRGEYRQQISEVRGEGHVL